MEEIEEKISLDGTDKRFWDFRSLFRTASDRYRSGMVIMIGAFGQLWVSLEHYCLGRPLTELQPVKLWKRAYYLFPTCALESGWNHLARQEAHLELCQFVSISNYACIHLLTMAQCYIYGRRSHWFCAGRSLWTSSAVARKHVHPRPNARHHNWVA
jgi:hypothetical protein